MEGDTAPSLGERRDRDLNNREAFASEAREASAGPPAPALVFRRIEKTYEPPVSALRSLGGGLWNLLRGRRARRKPPIRLTDGDRPLVLERNKIVALVGSSGSGKSTVLGMIAGDIAPDASRAGVAPSIQFFPAEPKAEPPEPWWRRQARRLLPASVLPPPQDPAAPIELLRLTTHPEPDRSFWLWLLTRPLAWLPWPSARARAHRRRQKAEKASWSRARNYVGSVFQEGYLIDNLRNRQNVALPLRLVGRKVRTERTHALGGSMGLDAQLLRRTPAEVSGGQAQRLSVARALSHMPELLLADEPTSKLDETTARGVLDLIKAARDRRVAGEAAAGAGALSTILVTHNIPLAIDYADEIWALNLPPEPEEGAPPPPPAPATIYQDVASVRRDPAARERLHHEIMRCFEPPKRAETSDAESERAAVLQSERPPHTPLRSKFWFLVYFIAGGLVLPAQISRRSSLLKKLFGLRTPLSSAIVSVSLTLFFAMSVMLAGVWFQDLYKAQLRDPNVGVLDLKSSGDPLRDFDDKILALLESARVVEEDSVVELRFALPGLEGATLRWPTVRRRLLTADELTPAQEARAVKAFSVVHGAVRDRLTIADPREAAAMRAGEAGRLDGDSIFPDTKTLGVHALDPRDPVLDGVTIAPVAGGPPVDLRTYARALATVAPETQAPDPDSETGVGDGAVDAQANCLLRLPGIFVSRRWLKDRRNFRGRLGERPQSLFIDLANEQTLDRWSGARTDCKGAGGVQPLLYRGVDYGRYLELPVLGVIISGGDQFEAIIPRGTLRDLQVLAGEDERDTRFFTRITPYPRDIFEDGDVILSGIRDEAGPFKLPGDPLFEKRFRDLKPAIAFTNAFVAFVVGAVMVFGLFATWVTVSETLDRQRNAIGVLKSFGIGPWMLEIAYWVQWALIFTAALIMASLATLAFWLTLQVATPALAGAAGFRKIESVDLAAAFMAAPWSALGAIVLLLFGASLLVVSLIVGQYNSARARELLKN